MFIPPDSLLPLIRLRMDSSNLLHKFEMLVEALKKSKNEETKFNDNSPVTATPVGSIR
jgi:hypothetical protein